MAPIAPITPALMPSSSTLQGIPPMTAGMMQLGQLSNVATAQQAPLATFQEFFADAVKKTNELEGAASEKQRQLLVGETDNIHDVMIAMEKASLSLNLTLAVRNKVLDAYQEVMRMQI